MKRRKSRAKPNESWYEFSRELEVRLPGFTTRLAKKSKKLSSAELHVCAMVRCGLKSYEIAERMFVTEYTIEKHRSNARTKLRVRKGIAFEVFLKSI